MLGVPNTHLADKIKRKQIQLKRVEKFPHGNASNKQAELNAVSQELTQLQEEAKAQSGRLPLNSSRITHYKYSIETSALKHLALTDMTEASAPAPTSDTYRLGTDKDQNVWIRTFLISPFPNKRGWSVDRNTIERNLRKSAHGKPLVFDAWKQDHPEWDSFKSAEANMKNQEKYKIGTIEKVFYNKENDCYYADCKVTDERAKSFINSFIDKHLPIPVSPQILYNPRFEQENYYRDWQLSHLALVPKGAAYGADARVLHICTGDSDTCCKQFQNTAATAASVQEKKDKKAAAAASLPAAFLNSLVRAPPNGTSRGPLA